MSTEEAELPGEEDERGWRERFGQVTAAGRPLLATRLEILREELAGKAAFAVRGIAGAVVAAALGIGTLLLFAALLAALLAGLLKSWVLGILVAVILYAAGAAAAAWVAFRALTQVRPLEFPAVTGELARDWQAVAASLSPEPEPDAEDDGAGEPIDDIEERFRRGAE
jgi:hypothetical protein